MRLMLLLGVAMIVFTTLIVVYGFKRTEELRSEEHTQVLMRQPRDGAFGDVPVGLIIGQGGSVMPAEGEARFEDGLLVSLTAIDRMRGSEGVPEGTLLATLHLSGGGIGDPQGIDVRLSPVAPQWADRGYLFTLLEVDPRAMVFTVNQTGIR